MRQRLDIADVEERTKIRAKYLRALENEEFSLLPGPTYVRTFLRTYAEFLGLDARRLVEQYRAEWEPETAAVEQRGTLPPPPEPGRRPPSPPRGPRPLAVAAVLAGLLLAVLFVLGLTGEDQSGEESGATSTSGTRATSRGPGGAPPARTRGRRSTTARAVVVLQPAVPTYVCVDRGPGTAITYEGIASSELRFSGPRIRLNLGKTSVAVRVNGRALTIPPGPNPVGYDVVGARVRPLAPAQRPCVARPTGTGSSTQSATGHTASGQGASGSGTNVNTGPP